MKANRRETATRIGDRRRACRGQGLLEYTLILAVVTAVTLSVMTTVASSVKNLIGVLVDNIESVTEVSDPSG